MRLVYERSLLDWMMSCAGIPMGYGVECGTWHFFETGLYVLLLAGGYACFKLWS